MNILGTALPNTLLHAFLLLAAAWRGYAVQAAKIDKDMQAHKRPIGYHELSSPTSAVSIMEISSMTALKTLEDWP